MDPCKELGRGTQKNCTTGALGLVSEQTYAHDSTCPSSHVSWSVQGRAPEIRKCRNHSNGMVFNLESLNHQYMRVIYLFILRWSQYVALADLELTV